MIEMQLTFGIKVNPRTMQTSMKITDIHILAITLIPDTAKMTIPSKISMIQEQ